MRIAITAQGPELTSQVDLRFGRARYLVIFDTETEHFTVFNNEENMAEPQGAGIRTAKLIAEQDVALVVSGHVGPKAMQVLELAGIEVFPATTGHVEEVLQKVKPKIIERQRARAAGKRTS